MGTSVSHHSSTQWKKISSLYLKAHEHRKEFIHRLAEILEYEIQEFTNCKSIVESLLIVDRVLGDLKHETLMSLRSLYNIPVDVHAIAPFIASYLNKHIKEIWRTNNESPLYGEFMTNSVIRTFYSLVCENIFEYYHSPLDKLKEKLCERNNNEGDLVIKLKPFMSYMKEFLTYLISRDISLFIGSPNLSNMRTEKALYKQAHNFVDKEMRRFENQAPERLKVKLSHSVVKPEDYREAVDLFIKNTFIK